LPELDAAYHVALDDRTVAPETTKPSAPSLMSWSARVDSHVSMLW